MEDLEWFICISSDKKLGKLLHEWLDNKSYAPVKNVALLISSDCKADVQLCKNFRSSRALRLPSKYYFSPIRTIHNIKNKVRFKVLEIKLYLMCFSIKFA